MNSVHQGSNGKIVYEKYWADQQNCWVYNMLSPIYKDGKQYGVLKDIKTLIEILGRTADLNLVQDEQLVALSKRSSEIGSVVDTIVAISEQTNLLALKASIEAAISEETSASAEEIYSISTSEITEMENLNSEVNNLKDSIINVVNEVDKIKL